MAKIRTDALADPETRFDARLTNPRGVRFAYAQPAPRSRAEWEARAEWVRRRILLAGNLCPWPDRTPLRERVFGKTDLGGCTLEKVCFESRPGFLVTGNLFRPAQRKGRCPAALCPHGHWPQGRLTPESADKGSVLARCLSLARLGFVVFVYDMIGYADSCQLPHRWEKDALRRRLLRGIGPFSLQLWNSIRAADFVCGLPDVDANRLGSTGASGGATQAYYHAAIDDRVKVVVPVCMMSSHFQGGCQCEEPPLIHLDDLTTLDVVGSLAPRPVLLPSVTQDWTNQNPTMDVPAIRRIYALYGAEDRLGNVHLDAPHNYNRDTREHAYAWFRRWLADDERAGKRIREPSLNMPEMDVFRIFPDGKPPTRYKSGDAVLADMEKRIPSFPGAPPHSRRELDALRRTWRETYAEVMGASEPDEPVSVGTALALGEGANFTVTGRVIGRCGRGEQTPALWIVPRTATSRSPAALVVCGEGKAALLRGSRFAPVLRVLLDAGVRVLAIDMLGKGETEPFLNEERGDRANPIFYAFNRSLTALRVQEILTALKALRDQDGSGAPLLIGTGQGGVAALLARPLAGPLSGTLADLAGLTADDAAFWTGEAYHPFILKLGGLRGAVALGPTSPLSLANTQPALVRWARKVYGLEGKARALGFADGAKGMARAIVRMSRLAARADGSC